jgi:uncharacterized protein (DUF1778 family)
MYLRPVAKPAKPAKRNHMLRVRVSDAEYRIMQETARKNGMDLSNFIRSLALRAARAS